jgi:hypothetical protein
MRKLLFVILLLFGVPSVFAQSGGAVAAFCDADSEGCRELATEVARIEMLRKMDASSRQSGALVCSPDNASLMRPLCAVSERLLITTALIQVSPDIDWGDWSWVDPCWRPLGCDGIVIPEVVFPEPFPPVPICKIVGQGPGIIWLCWAPGTFTRDPPPPRSPPPPELVRHLKDNAVRLNAAKTLRDELTQMLRAVEEEIRVLTP